MNADRMNGFTFITEFALNILLEVVFVLMCNAYLVIRKTC